MCPVCNRPFAWRRK
ncbi:DUF2256 domain-containing protein [Tepidimonas sp.]